MLYVLVLGQGGGAGAVVASIAVLALALWMHVSSRRHYESMQFPWRRRWHVVAGLVAWTGVAFWLLFGLALFLTWRGVPILPS